MNTIDPMNKSTKISLITEPLAARLEKRDPSFTQRLKAAVGDVNTKQNVADDSIEQVIKGELGLHEGMMAIGKADISLKLLVQVRGKVMGAYQEIIRMQI